MNKAFFLDRDGTINVDYNFVHTLEEWTWCEGAIEAIRWMNKQDFKIIVVTNQSGISRGRYTEEHVRLLHNWVDSQLENHNLTIHDWYIAPWHPEYDPEPSKFNPSDRKPGTGMFIKAAGKHQIDFTASYMAGDKISDLKPAVELGINPLFIKSRHEPHQDRGWLEQHGIETFNNIKEAVQTI